jgi:septal ring factor EnvC (AmiA/AmiB activator)
MAHHAHHEESTQMTIWRRAVLRMIWLVALAVVAACFIGYHTAVSAQPDRQSAATQLAVDDNRITSVENQQARFTQRLDEMTAKLNDVNDRLANMQGIGTGAITLLTILNLAGISLQLRNRKPAS